MSPQLARYSRLGAIAILPILTAARTGASVAAEGWSFLWTSTSTARGAQPTEMRVRIAGQLARIDYVRAPQGMKRGSYIILDAEQGLMTMVSPSDKTAMLLPVGGLTSMLGAMGAQGLVKMDVSDVSVSVQDLGSGELILGHPTHRHLLKQSMTTSVSIMGMKRTSRSVTDTEMWIATDIPAAQIRVFEEFGRNFAQSSGIGALGGEGLQQLQAELQSKVPRGFPLKQVATTVTDPDGKATTSTTTTEVKEFQQASIDEAIFVVPADYKVTDMRKASDSLSQGRESARKEAAESSKAEQKGARAEAAGDGALSKVGGLFGRRPGTKTPPRDSAKKDTTRKPPM
jgi:hypothetical protein